MSRLPILVILGATGTGKSRLGIELARRFQGEIISADSMQVYKGLDIITAKVTKEEQTQARHHMIDVADPLDNYRVVDFQRSALPIIDGLIQTRKLPIVVGGTNYYIESLLWHILVSCRGELEEMLEDDEESNSTVDEDQISIDLKKVRLSEHISSQNLHRKLAEVDPEMASRLHPNNRRKIIRSLEVFEQLGVQHSELLRQQRMAGGCGLGGPLRHENTIIFWLKSNQEVLDSRLNERVDKMLSDGLIQELLDFHERYNKDRVLKNQQADYTKGVFQSIGFKEFHNYLILPQDKQQSDEGKKMLDDGIEMLKLATRRYARRQIKWINNRFIRRPDRQVPPVYILDCSDTDQWESEVHGKAVEIVTAFLNNETPTIQPSNLVKNGGANSEQAKDSDSSNMQIFYCETCERFCVGQSQWDDHMNGAKHVRVLKKKLRNQEDEDELRRMSEEQLRLLASEKESVKKDRRI